MHTKTQSLRQKERKKSVGGEIDREKVERKDKRRLWKQTELNEQKDAQVDEGFKERPSRMQQLKIGIQGHPSKLFIELTMYKILKAGL